MDPYAPMSEYFPVVPSVRGVHILVLAPKSNVANVAFDLGRTPKPAYVADDRVWQAFVTEENPMLAG